VIRHVRVPGLARLLSLRRSSIASCQAANDWSQNASSSGVKSPRGAVVRACLASALHTVLCCGQRAFWHALELRLAPGTLLGAETAAVGAGRCRAPHPGGRAWVSA
jgi:hypothetical protein